MRQARRVVVGVIAVIAVVLGFAPGASAQPTSRAAANATSPDGGYWLLKKSGGIFGGGNAKLYGSGETSLSSLPMVGIAATPSRNGYWTVASNGGIFSYGDAKFYGSTGAIRLNEAIVGMAATVSGKGYWLVAADGGIFSYGDATFMGSTGAISLNKPITGITASPGGMGYWMVASDGGIFSYGDAKFYGSTGSVNLNKPITGIASTPTGRGYWMVASDGGVFSFGDAKYFGSAGAMKLDQPITGMAATPSGRGYWLVAADGGVFSYGDATPFGSRIASAGLQSAVVGIAGSAPAPPAASALDITTDPSPSTGGLPFATQPVVHVLDTSGHLDATSTAPVHLSIASPRAGTALTCDDNTVNAIAGVATFAGCSINTSGRYTLNATSGHLRTSTTSATITVGTAAQLVFVQQPRASANGPDLSLSPHVALQDAGGNTLTVNVGNVRLSISPPNLTGAVLTCTSVNVAFVDGVASFANCSIDRSGSYQLRAVSGPLFRDSDALIITAA